MRSKLNGTTGHKQFKEYQDGISLLEMIKKIVYGVEESLQNKMATVMANKTLYTFWKNPDVKNND